MTTAVSIHDNDLSDSNDELEDLIAEYSNSKNNDMCQIQATPIKDAFQFNKEGQVAMSSVPMDKVLFGDKEQLLKNMSVDNESMNNIKVQKENDSESGKSDTNKKRKPAWTDTDDEELLVENATNKYWQRKQLIPEINKKSYKEYLTTKYTRLSHQPKWASMANKQQGEEEKTKDNDEDLLGTVGFIDEGDSNTVNLLPSNHISMHRLKDLNRSTYSEGYINSIQFHPHSTAALVAGDRNIATIYAIDGVRNEKLHNIKILNYPIKCTRILPCGTKAILGSVTRYIYIYDLIAAKEICYRIRKSNGNFQNFIISTCGKYLVSAGQMGEIHIYESKSFEHIRTLKQMDDVAAMCFTADSNQLICSSRTTPNIYIFSMRQQRQEHSFVDDGCICGSVLNLAPNQRLLATGSREGVVNVYDYKKVLSSNYPLPEKNFMNLRTAINCIQFNHSSELLAFSSSYAPNSVKLAHFPSGNVFPNFPVNYPNLGIVRTLAFSPHSAYFALGSKREAPLFRIQHYPNY